MVLPCKSTKSEDALKDLQIIYKLKQYELMSSMNCKKGTKEVLVNKNIEDYPKDGRGFKIIHPMYDRYSDHIELVGGILYRGKTPKGCFTIDTCHLYRVDLAKERVDKRIKEDKGEIISGIINLLSKSEEYVDDNMKFIQYVCDIVKKYKQETGQCPAEDTEVRRRTEEGNCF